MKRTTPSATRLLLFALVLIAIAVVTKKPKAVADEQVSVPAEGTLAETSAEQAEQSQDPSVTDTESQPSGEEAPASGARTHTRAWLARYASSLKGLKKAQLKTAASRLMQPKKVLDYGNGMQATWGGFWYTDRVNTTTNECFNRYSDERFYFVSHNGRRIDGMNIEHSFPKSWWGGSNEVDAYKDLFNLYPSDAEANRDKSNYAMGHVEVVKSSAGEGYDKVGRGRTSSNQQIMLWEPGDLFKGEFARSYFYMATTYQDYTWQGTRALQELENNTWPTLQRWAYTLYLQWVELDRVDNVETARNEAVYSIQGNRNLFIDFPFLAEYIWGDSIGVPFDPYTSITTASDDDRY